jgi:aldose sugar dehydrogenase
VAYELYHFNGFLGFMPVTFIKMIYMSSIKSAFFSYLILFLSPYVFSQDSNTVVTKSGKIKVEKLATLNLPWGMAWLPDGRLLITEKPGQLRIFADGKLSEPVTGLPKVEYRGQGGLLDVEVDPDFASNSFIYFSYSEAAEKQTPGSRDPGDPRLGPNQDYADGVLKGGAVARAKLQGNALTDVKVIWRQTPKTVGRGHFGGRIIFSADGKMLYILSGDRQRFDPAQDQSGNLGKVIRINKDGSIPADNPMAGKAGASKDIWSLGHRNPLGGAIHPTTKQLWIHEMGPAHGDELNIPEAGKNYGWPVVSNGENYDGSRIPDHETAPQFVKPVFYWHPAISPSGMIFYTGNMFPGWNGNILMGGFNPEALLRITLDGNQVKSEERIFLRKRIRDVAQAPDGSIWIVTDAKDGELLRLTAL